MNSDEVLAELDAQYQELIQSVQLEGLSQDENSEQSGQKHGEAFRKESLQNVSEIIRKYEQTLQTSRAFYENEIKKLEDTKQKTESKYIESKKQIKQFEHRIAQILENHQLQINTISTQKDTEIKELRDRLMNITEQHSKTREKHSKCSNIMHLNQDALEKLQQENAELQTQREVNTAELEQLQIEYDKQKELLSKKKTDIEKYKVEIIQTRTCLDEEKKEKQDLLQQLEECRNEINFLCTTNEDLYNINESLTKKLEKYPQANSLLNSVVWEDDKSEMSIKQQHKHQHNQQKQQQQQQAQQVVVEQKCDDEEKEEKKEDVENIGNVKNMGNIENIKNGLVVMSPSMSHEASIFNLEDNNMRLECPKLKTTSSMFMIESIEDSKIKEEMQRLESDRNTWNDQYKAICTEKDDLIQRITKYEQTIKDLQRQLSAQQSMAKEGQLTVPSQKEIESLVNIQTECDHLSKENKELKEANEEFKDRMKGLIDLNESNQDEINKLNDELAKLNGNKNEPLNYENKIAEMNHAFNIIQEENNKMRNDLSQHEKDRNELSQDVLALRENNSDLMNRINEYHRKCEESEKHGAGWNKRYEKLSNEYTTLQTQFHEIKMTLNETISKEEEYKQQIHKLSVNTKYIMQELQQSKDEEMNLRANNNKQTEEISQLNHDIKQIFRDLENGRMQLMQSQQLITTLEKQLFNQTQQLNQTRQQLQMQMQINMQNLNVMNRLKMTNNSTMSNIPSNIPNNNIMMNQNQNINKHNIPSAVATSNQQQTYIKHLLNPQKQQQHQHQQHQHQQRHQQQQQRSNPLIPSSNILKSSSISPSPIIPQQQQQQHRTTKPRSKTSIIPNDIMSIARGKPFFNRQNSSKLNNNNTACTNHEKLSLLLQQRQKLEAELFKLPTNPRSLEQRKRKQFLESTMLTVESQIESIKKSK